MERKNINREFKQLRVWNNAVNLYINTKTEFGMILLNNIVRTKIFKVGSGNTALNQYSNIPFFLKIIHFSDELKYIY